MSGWMFTVVFVSVWGLTCLFIRRDFDKETKSLTKKGFIKVIISLSIILMASFCVGFLTN